MNRDLMLDVFCMFLGGIGMGTAIYLSCAFRADALF